MYIPIGPSKKDLYKIIIGLLLLFYLIFLGMYKPKAQVTGGLAWNETSSVQGNLYTDIDTNAKIGIVNFERILFKNSGNGTITFTIISAPITSNPDGVVMSVRALGQVADYECSLSGGTWYVDNDTQRLLQQVTCPYNSDYNNGLKGLQFTRDGAYGKTRIYFPVYYSFVYGTDSSSQISDITSAINSSANAIISASNGNTTSIINAINGQTQAIVNAINSNNTTINNIQNNTQNISDSINDSSIDSSSANDLTSNSAFQDSNGLDAIIKAPLNFIQSLTSSTCSSINLTIPYIDADVSLPCMSTIYTKALGQQLVNLIALVINGVVLYRYCLKILQLVHDAKNPNKDELEVLDL